MFEIQINGIPIQIREGTVQINHKVGERSFCSFTALTDNKTRFSKGLEVKVYDNTQLVFAGSIDLVRDYTNDGSMVRDHLITCTDNHYFVDKRIFTKAFIETSAGDIVRTMIDNVLSEEGITYTDTSIQNGVKITHVFDHEYCNNILDKVCEMTGFTWWVNEYKVLYFIDPISNRNDKTITDEIIKAGSFEFVSDRSRFRNIQYIKGPRGLTGEKTEEFTYEGRSYSFVLTFPVGDLIDIKINGVSVDKSNIGKKADNVDAAFLWLKGDNTISYNHFSGLAVQGDTFSFVYKGHIPIIAIAKDNHLVEQIKHLENGGSGKVENIILDKSLEGMESSFLEASGKLKKYGILENKTVTFDTLESNYKPSQLVRLNSLSEGINEDFLVEQVFIRDEYDLLWYTIKLVKGGMFESWAKIFQKTMETNQSSMSDEKDFSLQETIIVPMILEQNWNLSSKLSPFTFYPSNSLIPSETTYPFIDDSFKYIEIDYIDENNEFNTIRKLKSYDVTLETNENTIFYIAPHEAIGEWQQFRFYGDCDSNELGEGTLMITVNNAFNKTILESVQIQRIDSLV